MRSNILIYDYGLSHIVMDTNERKKIIKEAKKFFKEKFAANQNKKLKKWNKVKNFKFNPFLVSYLGAFLTGNVSSESIARGLLYPRMLGTSPSTSFGITMQKFTTQVLKDIFGSGIRGVDLEFIDQVDKRKKYCQVKTGPDTINYDDVDTIKNHFTYLNGIARTNHLDIRQADMVVGILFGTKDLLNGSYKIVDKTYPVIIGKDFWERLTGDENFYEDLIKAFGEIAEETDSKELLEKVVKELATDIENTILKK